MQQQLVEEVFGAHIFNEILEFINDFVFVILLYSHILANNLPYKLQQVIRDEDRAIDSQSQGETQNEFRRNRFRSSLR